MKHKKPAKKIASLVIQNPVAKFAHLFNRAQAYDDKSKYSRRAKYPEKGVSLASPRFA